MCENAEIPDPQEASYTVHRLLNKSYAAGELVDLLTTMERYCGGDGEIRSRT
jgi:hypothetical protein